MRGVAVLVKKHKQPKGGPRSKYPGLPLILGFPSGSAVRNLPAIAGDTGSIGRQIGSGRCPGGGNGNPLQDSSLRNPMDRGAWQAIVHEVAKSRTWLLSDFHFASLHKTHFSSYAILLGLKYPFHFSW